MAYRYRFFIVIGFLLAGVWSAHAGGCAQENCQYLPFSRTEAVGVAPTIRATAFLPAPCDTNAPTPLEGLQAWLVKSSNTLLAVCTRLIVDGRSVINPPLQMIVHGDVSDTSFSLEPQISPIYLQAPGFYNMNGGMVTIDLAATYLDRVYLTRISYLARQYPTTTPAPTQKPTNTPTVTPSTTPTNTVTPTPINTPIA